MKDLIRWWFSPKKRFSSIIKILIGLLIVSSFFSTLIGNIIDLIDAYVDPPLYLGMSYLLLPITFTLFIKAVFWGGLFYLPYYIFGKRSEGRKRYLIAILLASLIIGSFGAVGIYTKPSTVEITRTQLALLEARLGEINRMGEFYTVREFGYDIAELTEPLPDFFVNEAGGFSKLVLFYKDCEKEWKVYYWLPSEPSRIRDEWRQSHIEAEAMMLFWGRVNKSVFYSGTKEWKKVSNLLLTWFNNYRIDRRMHPAFANWTLLPKEEYQWYITDKERNFNPDWIFSESQSSGVVAMCQAVPIGIPPIPIVAKSR